MNSARTVSTRLLVVLVCVLALLYAWVGGTAHGWDRFWGLGGAVLVLAAVLLARWSRAAALAVLTVGALPLAVATWWSIVTPVLALLVLVLGWTTLWRSPERRVPHERATSVSGPGQGDLGPCRSSAVAGVMEGHGQSGRAC